MHGRTGGLHPDAVRLIARVIVILPSPLSRAAWFSDSIAIVSPRCSRWFTRCEGRPMTVRTRGLMIGKRIRGALAPERHGSQDLCSAFVAAVVHVNELAARERNALAHLHERLAPWASRRRRFQLRLGFILGCHHPRPLALDAALAAPSLQPASSTPGPRNPQGPHLLVGRSIRDHAAV